MARISFFAAIVLGIGVAEGLSADDPQLRAAAIDTSRLMGSPDALPAMEVERVFRNLRLPSPVQPTHAGDNTNRVFVVTQPGVIFVFPNDRETSSAQVFLDLRDRVINPGGDNGMFAVAFHPQYRNNGEFYVVYGSRSRPKATIVSRFSVSDDHPNRANPDSEEVLLKVRQPWPDHICRFC